ncbi:hypothetical protein [Streptomyces sp. NPDC002088]|uniref:hypothetical protein n=1 Tax=Streptomyces sp. NPDC002088 TaxID=3154665 RepID=UPI0033346F3B
MAGDFSIEEAERRLGPAAAERARQIAAAAPEFRPEQIEHLRALFASAAFARPTVPAADAA